MDIVAPMCKHYVHTYHLMKPRWYVCVSNNEYHFSIAGWKQKRPYQQDAINFDCAVI